MNISAPFIERPIATSLLTVALLLAGGVAFPHIPVAPLPEVEYPTINVFSGLPGASPETMASSVATPLERMFGRIAGITQMTSISQLGNTSIVMQFDLDRKRRCRRTRRSGGHQCRARPATREPSEQSDLAQGKPSRIRDFGFGADVGNRHPAAALRRGRVHFGAEDTADRRHRAGQPGRQFAAGSPRRGQPDAVEQARRRARSGGRRSQCGERPFAEGRTVELGIQLRP